MVTDPTDRERLRTGGFVVWLRADIETLIARVRGTDRPWLGDSPDVAMRELYAGREPLYTEVATLIVDVDGATPEQTADRIITALPGAAPTPRPNPS